MKKVVWAFVPVVSLGLLSWLPFVVLKDQAKTWIFVLATLAQIALLTSLPETEGWSAFGGFYIVLLVAFASVFAALGFAEKERQARERAAFGQAPYDPFKK